MLDNSNPGINKTTDLRIAGVSLPSSSDLKLNQEFGYENKLFGEKAARELLDSFLEPRATKNS